MLLLSALFLDVSACMKPLLHVDSLLYIASILLCIYTVTLWLCTCERHCYSTDLTFMLKVYKFEITILYDIAHIFWTVAAEFNTQVCELAIQTVVCDNVVGNISQKVSVTLRGKHPLLNCFRPYIKMMKCTLVPEAPVLNVIPVYSYATRKLTCLITRFNKEVDPDLSSSCMNINQAKRQLPLLKQTNCFCCSTTLLRMGQ